jgi:hypothetical protein
MPYKARRMHFSQGPVSAPTPHLQIALPSRTYVMLLRRGRSHSKLVKAGGGDPSRPLLAVPRNQATRYNHGMGSGRASLVEPETVVEYVSALGPRVTHVRGTLLAGSQATLRELGVYERYQELLPLEVRETLLCVLASSWVPIEAAVAHYETCDALTLDQAQIKLAGERMASRIVETFAGAALRTARSLGADSFWLVLQQNDRFYDRLYQGGGVNVLQTGPKDVILENHGQPLAAIRYWRASYLAYMEALGKAFTNISYVKLVHPRTPGPHSIAVAGSWV